MKSQITLQDRPIQISLTSAAEAALSKTQQPLLAEMELYFSCLIRKQVRFYSGRQSDDAAAVGERLAVRFRPVMTQSCGSDYEGDEPPLTDFPIVDAARFIPHWLNIDYRNGEWTGEFGYR